MIIEKDAHKKWCHQISGECVGSRCMAWRWFDTLTDDGTACNWMSSAMAARLPKDTEPKPLDQRRGFCGLAGKP